MKNFSFFVTLLFICLTGCAANATPYFDPNQVPKDESYPPLEKLPVLDRPQWRRGAIETGFECLRVAVKVDLATENYELARVVRDSSATAALIRRAPQPSKYGSYRARIRDAKTKAVLAHDSIGTGRQYRKLIDEITFRFPFPKEKVLFELLAEHPEGGEMQRVLAAEIDPRRATSPSADVAGVEIREILRPQKPSEAVRVNIYAEGYLAEKKTEFWRDAEKVARTLLTNRFPGIEKMHFFAVFKPSREAIGQAKDLGSRRVSRDSFLSLYFPHWNKFGRWYHVVYPTEEERFRGGLALAPYDYAIALVDDDAYWGIGNFRVMTAVPSRNLHFTYLLLHEAGHFFGLNEEYQEEGSTELEFAPGVHEPWSPNITFLRDPRLKWSRFVRPQTAVPTPAEEWRSDPPNYGAYAGGYAGSLPLHQSHKPGLNCVMEQASDFCSICRAAIEEIVDFDRGVKSKNSVRRH